MTTFTYYHKDIPMGIIGVSRLYMSYSGLCTFCQQLSRAAYHVVPRGQCVSNYLWMCYPRLRFLEEGLIQTAWSSI